MASLIWRLEMGATDVAARRSAATLWTEESVHYDMAARRSAATKKKTEQAKPAPFPNNLYYFSSSIFFVSTKSSARIRQKYIPLDTFLSLSSFPLQTTLCFPAGRVSFMRDFTFCHLILQISIRRFDSTEREKLIVVSGLNGLGQLLYRAVSKTSGIISCSSSFLLYKFAIL